MEDVKQIQIERQVYTAQPIPSDRMCAAGGYGDCAEWIVSGSFGPVGPYCTEHAQNEFPELFDTTVYVRFGGPIPNADRTWGPLHSCAACSHVTEQTFMADSESHHILNRSSSPVEAPLCVRCWSRLLKAL